MKPENTRETAEQISDRVFASGLSRTALRDELEAALNARDERAARIAETHQCKNSNNGCGVSIAAAIRGKD